MPHTPVDEIKAQQGIYMIYTRLQRPARPLEAIRGLEAVQAQTWVLVGVRKCDALIIHSSPPSFPTIVAPNRNISIALSYYNTYNILHTAQGNTEAET